MTVSELMEELKDENPDAVVVIASQINNEKYYLAAGYSIGRYDHIKQRFGERGQDAVCLWPSF